MAGCSLCWLPGDGRGDLYTQSGLKRDVNGMVEIDPSGGLVTVDNLQDIKLGSVFPKANLAWRNAFDSFLQVCR